MKKIFNLSIKNIKGSPAFTILGAVAAIALPVATQHMNAETLGGAVVLFVLGALAGYKNGNKANNPLR